MNDEPRYTQADHDSWHKAMSDAAARHAEERAEWYRNGYDRGRQAEWHRVRIALDALPADELWNGAAVRAALETTAPTR